MKRVKAFLLMLVLLIGILPFFSQTAAAAVTRYWPVPDETHVGGSYSPPNHYGIDINGAGVEGKTVINVIGGTVCAIYKCERNHYGDISSSCCSGFGTGVVIAGEDGYFYQYAHMQGGSMPGYVYYGAPIPAGWEIGKVGNTGNSTGPHLHYQVSTSGNNMNSNSISPWSFTYTYSTPAPDPDVSYENLGENFYAHIRYPATGHGVCNVNGNVELGAYNTQNSLWQFIRQSDGSYKIISALNGNVLDVFNNDTANETNLWTYPSNDTTAQRFYIRADGNNYNIVAANSGKVMDVKYGASSTIGTNIHIYSSTGSVDQQFEINKVNWLQLGNHWFYFADGAFKTGWQRIGGTWYYFNTNGSMKTGWLKQGSSWYYLNPAGNMATGWAQIGGTWYYFNSSGAMQTGWKQVGATWYYFHSSGAMATGWCKVGSIYYYFASSGAMVTGWLRDGRTWYYMNTSGAMVTGWAQIGGTWYYFNSSGAMQTGWLKLGNTWYYFKSSGAMATGTVTIGGATYRFAASGAWIP